MTLTFLVEDMPTLCGWPLGGPLQPVQELLARPLDRQVNRGPGGLREWLWAVGCRGCQQ